MWGNIPSFITPSLVFRPHPNSFSFSFCSNQLWGGFLVFSEVWGVLSEFSNCSLCIIPLFFSFIFISWRLITLQYCSGFCHTLTWINHGFTCIPHPDHLSHLPLHPIPLGLPSAPALSTLYHASNLDWRFVSHIIIYMFQYHSPISSHPCPLPQSPKASSIHLCLFCCRAYRVIITIFLNSIYMH